MPFVADPTAVAIDRINRIRVAHGLPPIGAPGGTAQPGLPPTFGDPRNTIPTARDAAGNVVPPSDFITQQVLDALRNPRPIPVTHTWPPEQNTQAIGALAASTIPNISLGVTVAKPLKKSAPPGDKQPPGKQPPPPGPSGPTVWPWPTGTPGSTGAPVVIPYSQVDTSAALKALAASKQMQDRLAHAVVAALNIPSGRLHKIALAEAKKQVAANVAQLTGQQKQIRDEGERIAQGFQVGAASLAQLNQNLPGMLQENYNRAASVLSGIAGGVANTAGQLAQPGQPVAPGASIGDTGSYPAAIQGAVNAAYGGPLTPPGQAPRVGPGGTPAALQIAGDAARVGAGGVLAGMIGQGTQSAQLARGAANQQAMQLLPDIEAAQARLGPLTAQNFASLSSAWTQTANAKVAALKALAAGYLTPAQAAKMIMDAEIHNKTWVNQAAIAGARIGAQTAGTGPKTIGPFGDKDRGYTILDAATGHVVYYEPPLGAGAKGISDVQVRYQLNKMQGIANGMDDLAGGVLEHRTNAAGEISWKVVKNPVAPAVAWRKIIGAYPWIAADPQKEQWLLQQFNLAYRQQTLTTGAGHPKSPASVAPYPELILQNGNLYFVNPIAASRGRSTLTLATIAPDPQQPPAG